MHEAAQFSHGQANNEDLGGGGAGVEEQLFGGWGSNLQEGKKQVLVNVNLSDPE